VDRDRQAQTFRIEAPERPGQEPRGRGGLLTTDPQGTGAALPDPPGGVVQVIQAREGLRDLMGEGPTL